MTYIFNSNDRRSNGLFMPNLKDLNIIYFFKKILSKKYALIFISIILLAIVCFSTRYFNNSSSKNELVHNNDLESKSVDNSNAQLFDKMINEVTSKKAKLNNVILTNANIGIPVLYYHSVTEPATNEVIITPEKLKAELTYIKNQGYITLTMKDLKNYLLNHSLIPEKSILITFDDGYMDNYYNAFPILKELNMNATIFCITSNLDGNYYLSKEAIKEMSTYGIDIESHTINHPHLNKLTYEDQLKELTESKKTLESITGKEVTSIAYPFGDYNEDSIKAAKNSGYTFGFTTNRGLADKDDNFFKLDRIYISSTYDMDTFKDVLTKTKK